MPLVSIILPTFNRAKSIEKSIKSILNQTFKDFELIIVDDGSNDNTEEVVSNFKDSRIILLKNSVNKGQSAARNIGIKNINKDSKFIGFQDSDDIWIKNKLELQIRTFKKSPKNVGVVFCSYKKIYHNKTYELIPSQKIPEIGDMYYKLLESSFIGTPTAIIKKQCIEKVGGFDESLTYLEDWEFFIRISKFFHIKFINIPLLYSYESFEGITSSVIQSSHLKPMLVIFYKNRNEIISKKTLLDKYLYIIGVAYFLNKNFRKSKIYLKQRFRIRPYNLKYLFYLLMSSIFFKNYIFNIYEFLITRYQKFFRFFINKD